MLHNFQLWLETHQLIFSYVSYAILTIGLLQTFIYILQLPLAALELFRMKSRNHESHTWWLSSSNITQPISILIPAYNEEVNIVENLRSTLALQYPVYEVIIINDGSTDRTLEKLIKEFYLEPSYLSYEYAIPCKKIHQIYKSKIYDNLIVIDKINGKCKADALNAGLNVARYPTFCTLDADSLLEPNALLESVQPFINNPEHTVAVGGTIRILNGCELKDGVVTQARFPKNILAQFQVMEYLRAFIMGRLAWSRLGILTIVSGAFALIQREVAMEVGGFNPKNMGEDYDLILRIHRYMCKNKKKYNIEFVPEPVCWTEVPEDLDVLKSQRIRWQQGALEVFFQNLSIFCNPRYGKIGMIAFPLSFLFDVLSPIAELFGYLLIPMLYQFDIIEVDILLSFLALFLVMGIFISVMSLILEEMSLKRFRHAYSLIKLTAIAILENFGYRQLNNLWRIIGLWRFIRGKKSWGKMTRIVR